MEGIIKLIVAVVVGFGIFWLVGKIRESSGRFMIFSAIMDLVPTIIRVILYYVAAGMGLYYLFSLSFMSVFFMGLAIGGAIATVRYIIIDIKEYFIGYSR